MASKCDLHPFDPRIPAKVARKVFKSQAEMAEFLMVTPGYISKLVKEDAYMPGKHAHQLCTAFPWAFERFTYKPAPSVKAGLARVRQAKSASK